MKQRIPAKALPKMVACTLAGALALGALCGCSQLSGLASGSEARLPAPKIPSAVSTAASAASSAAGEETGFASVGAGLETYTAEFFLPPSPESSAKQTVAKLRYDSLTLGGGAEPTADTYTYVESFNEMQSTRLREELAFHGQDLYELFLAGNTAAWERINQITVCRADTALLSFYVEEYSYMGGTHPSVWYMGHTFDAVRSRELELQDLIQNKEAFAQAVYAAMMQQERLRELEAARQGAKIESLLDTVRGCLQEGGAMPAFAVAANGKSIRVLFGDYMLGSYAEGRAVVDVPVEGNEAAFRTELLYPVAGSAGQVVPLTAAKMPQEEQHFGDFCAETAGFYPKDFSAEAGIYAAENGMKLEITSYGSFDLYSANGTLETGGYLRATQGPIRMYGYKPGAYPENLREQEDCLYGYLDILPDTEATVTVRESETATVFTRQ